MRFGLMLGDIWFVCFAMLLVVTVSRYFFDPASEYEGRHTMFLKRLGASIVWPIMLFSAGGRQKLVNILKGE